MPEVFTGGKKVPFKTADDLIAEGEKLPKLEPLRMEKGQAAVQAAYLCYSSGTSGLPVSIFSALNRKISERYWKLRFPMEGKLLTTSSERSHDQPSKCHSKRPTT